jgi:hypothetical protein
MDVNLILGEGHQEERSHEWRLTDRKRLEDFSDEECQKKFRLPKQTLREIITNLSEDLAAPTQRNNPIPVDTQALLSLRLLASGSFQGVTGDTGNISQPSMSRILHRFCSSFSRRYRYLLKWYQTEEETREAKKKFFRDTQVKGLLGLVDGSMIPIKGVSGDDEPAYICRKNFPAINVQVILLNNKKIDLSLFSLKFLIINQGK